MRDLTIIAEECMRELDAIDIQYGKILEFKVNTRAKKRWGRCCTVPGGYKIEINVDLLDEQNDIDGLKNTIIHELLHSCPGCMNHGERWKQMAEKVRRAYGYNIKRCSSEEEKGVHRLPDAIHKSKYTLKCRCCGSLILRERASNVVRHPEKYRCSQCGGDIYLL